MADSFIPYGPDPASPARRAATVKRPSAARDGVTDTFHHDLVIPTDRRIVTYKGNVGTFRTPGRAGTTGQNLFAIHNATGSTVLVDVSSLNVSLYDTAAKVVAPPLIRAWRFTAIPTNGTVLSKRGPDSGQTSNSSVTVWGDASADGTGSATTLTITRPANMFISQTPASRALTLVGAEPIREVPMLQYSGVQKLRALEGVVIFLDYTVATSNPVTDMWQVDCVWDEYTEF